MTAIVVVCGLVAALAGFDLLADLGEGGTLGHLLAEGAVVVVGLGGALAVGARLLRLTREARAARAEAADLHVRLAATEAEAARWRGETKVLLAGLGEAIDQQFERWKLSPAEKEVALLLLKGLSHNEVAQVRSITSATARQQAGAIYKKAGVSGRSDLAAFFLEDLLLPGPQAGGRGEPAPPAEDRRGG